MSPADPPKTPPTLSDAFFCALGESEIVRRLRSSAVLRGCLWESSDTAQKFCVSARCEDGRNVSVCRAGRSDQFILTSAALHQNAFETIRTELFALLDAEPTATRAMRLVEQAAREGAPSLELAALYLTELPPGIGQLTQLEILELDENRLRTLPPEIFRLTQLEWLTVSSNQLSELPPEVGQLVNLHKLSLSHNRLNRLPAEIGQLRNLEHLELGSNQLKSLPPEIGLLANLRALLVGHNLLEDLPAEIGQLAQLRSLNLMANRLTTLPPELGRLTIRAWKKALGPYPRPGLSLQENPLLDPPPEVCKKGTEEILAYLRAKL